MSIFCCLVAGNCWGGESISLSAAQAAARSKSVLGSGRGPNVIVFPGDPVGPSVPPRKLFISPVSIAPISNPAVSEQGIDLKELHSNELGEPSAASAEVGTFPFGSDFRKLDSGLTDCEIPFEKLQSTSPHCTGGTHNSNRRCEQYSPSQFPEVVSILIKNSTGTAQCTGTVVAQDWVLTAAHCLLGDSAATAAAGSDGADMIIKPDSPDFLVVEAANAITLPNDQRVRRVTVATVYGKYAGKGKLAPFYANDLALLKLSAPYPATGIQSAGLAESKDLSPDTTLAGFGYTDADGGALGQFNVTWPKKLSVAGDELQVAQDDNGAESEGGFCQGDSGGPVFAGRSRGCSSESGEKRPRLLEALISYNYPGIVINSQNENLRSAQRCRIATQMVMQNLTVDKKAQWICKTTSNAVLGCVTR